MPSSLVPITLEKVQCDATVDRIVCPSCREQMTYSTGVMDWDTLQEDGAPTMEYLYICAPCGLKTKSPKQFPQVTLMIEGSEPFSVIPAH